MNRIRNALKAPFPFFLNDEKKNAVLCVGVCIFLTVFILIFNPRAIHNVGKVMWIVGFTFMILFPGLTLSPRIFPAAFDTVQWTLGKHLAFTGFLTLVIGAVISSGLYLLNYYPYFNFAQTVMHIYPDVFTYGVIPITLVTLIARNQMLNENLKNALRASQELDRIQEIKVRTLAGRNDYTTTIQADTSETLQLNMTSLLFVEADDNYATFHWRDGQGLNKKMLRMNLKSAESQLNNTFMIRCHRSFIVNVNVIGTIAGNTNGYRLGISDTDFSIPVSRSKGREVIRKIEELRSLMELQ